MGQLHTLPTFPMVETITLEEFCEADLASQFAPRHTLTDDSVVLTINRRELLICTREGACMRVTYQG